MITRRDLTVAGISILATMAAVALAQNAAAPVMHSRVFQWGDLKPEKTKFGGRRAVFDGPTANLTRFECHVSTLNPGQMPHPPHRHAHEELMIIREGEVEAAQNGVTNRVGPGGIIYEAPGEMHGLKNTGTNPAVYFVLAWYPHDLPAGDQVK